MSGSAAEGLAGRVAIVTGGGRGLGRAMALGLARAGATVIATAARESAELAALAEEASRILPPLLWLASVASDGVTSMRFNAALWRGDADESVAAEAAGERL